MSLAGTVVYHVTRPDRDPAVLVRGRSLKIGRHPSNDVVLRHVSVSRHHATLKWERGADAPILVDEGSANGVDIEGRPVEGSLVITSRSAVEVGDVQIVIEPVVLETQPNDTRRVPVRGVAQGKFDDPGKIHRMLLRVEARGQSGSLRLADKSARYEISLRKGRIVSASSADGNLIGVMALKLALRVQAGGYRFALKEVAESDQLDLSPKEFVEQEFADQFQASELKTARFSRISSQLSNMLGELKVKAEAEPEPEPEPKSEEEA